MARSPRGAAPPPHSSRASWGAGRPGQAFGEKCRAEGFGGRGNAVTGLRQQAAGGQSARTPLISSPSLTCGPPDSPREARNTQRFPASSDTFFSGHSRTDVSEAPGVPRAGPGTQLRGLFWRSELGDHSSGPRGLWGPLLVQKACLFSREATCTQTWRGFPPT